MDKETSVIISGLAHQGVIGKTASTGRLSSALKTLTRNLDPLTANTPRLTRDVDALSGKVETLTLNIGPLSANVDALTGQADTPTANAGALTFNDGPLTSNVFLRQFISNPLTDSQLHTKT